MENYLDDLTWCHNELKKKISNNSYDLEEIITLISNLKKSIEKLNNTSNTSNTISEKQKKILLGIIIAEYLL